jgi:hypothetical protein
MNFEQAGKKLDKEIARLKVYLDKEVKPTTREEMARVLRSASERLSKLAKDLEKKTKK